MSIAESNPHGRLSETRLVDFERALGAELPAEYRRFLLAHNGGRPIPAHFHTGPRDVSRLHDVYGLHDGPPHRRLDQVRAVLADRVPEDLLAIAADPFGNQACLVCRGPRRGHVMFWDHETGRTSELAADFAAFLATLFEWVDPHESLFSRLARTDDMAGLAAFIASAADIDEPDRHGRTLLETAAVWGRTEMVRALLEAGARIGNARQLAHENGHEYLIELLDAVEPP